MDEITAEMIERGRSPDGRSQRRRRGVKVREAREKLTTSDTGHRGCDVGLLRAYASARLHSAVPASALIAMVAALTRYWMEGELEIVWTTFAFSTLLLCYGFAKRLDQLADAEINVISWRSKFVAAEFAHGLVWASMAALLLQAGDPNAKAFVLAMLMLAAAFNTMVDGDDSDRRLCDRHADLASPSSLVCASPRSRTRASRCSPSSARRRCSSWCWPSASTM